MYKFICFGDVCIPAYGLCMVIAMLLCGYLSVRSAVKRNISFENIIIILASVVGCSLVGANLLYIIVSFSAKEIIQIIANGNIAQLFRGGLVFFGGVIAGVIGGIVCCLLLKEDIRRVEHSTIPYLPLAHAIGRIGCLLAGCCYGFEYSGILAVKNPTVSSTATFFPVQPLEALLDIIIFIILLLYSQKKRPPFSVLTVYLISYSAVRFFTEFLRGDAVRGSFLSFSTSQWISLGLILLCILYKFFSHNYKRKRLEK